MISPINLSSCDNLISLLRKLVNDGEKCTVEELANAAIDIKPNDLVVAEDGNTYLKSDIVSTDIYPLKKLAPNRQLVDAISSKTLRKALLLGNEVTEDEQDEIKQLYSCPISLEVTYLPIITPGGYLYDQREIQTSLVRSGPRDPYTRDPLYRDQLIPNSCLLQLLILYAQKDKSILDVLVDRVKDLRDGEKEAAGRLQEIEKAIRPNKMLTIILALIAIGVYGSMIASITIPKLRSTLYPTALGPWPGGLLVCAVSISIACCCCACSQWMKGKERLNEELNLQKDTLSAKTTLLKLEESVIKPLLESHSIQLEKDEEVIVVIDDGAESEKPTEKTPLNTAYMV